ncbi:3-phosphoshikimate 1-carboxyvinyltransferase [Euryhalocaulis caribicus]|uniref:3-phosphoshikimate 1-carboxyvinyltransferase n=1 Tax=Euryhalocaulis caribicus TaxID=1161401 RepID=UPI000478AB8F|nr:3-phosphoshikimate 1-carboxyvinyltransferase [Euryhalocaulis caribicus]
MTNHTPSPLSAPPSGALRGVFSPPGDKSVSHRAVMFAAMASGRSDLTGLLEGEDVLATLKAVQAMGAETERTGDGAWRVTGAPPWRGPAQDIDLGNSGTSARLLAGAIAGMGVQARLTGDDSLRARPMERVAAPLRLMGAALETTDGRLPMTIRGARLRGVDYETPVASAQIKSAVLLAGLGAEGVTRVTEPAPSRDHTERMLPAFGGEVRVSGLTAEVTGGQRLSPANYAAPADPSSAAFALAAALITPGSRVTARGVLLNPRRAGLFEAWKRMGADLTIEVTKNDGEPVGDLIAACSDLAPIHVREDEIPAMIDEIPILAVTAAFAEGESRFEGLAELRVKESDRLTAVSDLLRAAGVETETGEDWLTVAGRGTGGVTGGGAAAARGDHRIAMSTLILGLASRKGMAIDDASMIATSYPAFQADLAALGAALETP